MCASELPVYGSGCFRGSGGDGMIAKALHYKSQGYKAIKMQMAHTNNLRGDVDNVKRMREALGPDIDIMIDINQGWTADVAINQGRKIVDYDIYWLEEPVPADDFKGYMRVADALPIRIVGGETHFTRFDLRPFFENPQIPILQPDPMRGGYTDLRKISVLADTWGLQMAPHLFPELNVQLLASIPNGAWIEDMGLSEDLWVEPVQGHQRHDHRAGAARPRPGVQAGDLEGLQGRLIHDPTHHRRHDGAVRARHRNLRPQQAARPISAKYTPERTLLFVHGSTYPAHTGFDIPLGGQSWMEYIAVARLRRLLPRRARLWPLDAARRRWHEPPQNNPPVARTPDAVKDITAVLNFILKRRSIAKLNLLGWSWGCTLMATTAIQNPDKIARLMLYAPGVAPHHAVAAAAGPGPLGAYRTVTREQAKARWLNGVPRGQAGGAHSARLVRAMGRRHLGDRSGRRQDKIRRWSARRTAPCRTPQEFWTSGKTMYDPAQDHRADPDRDRRMGQATRRRTWRRRSSRCW